MLAAARRVAGLALDRAVAEAHLDMHFVPVRGAERRDRRVVHHLHLARERDPRRIVDAVRREFIDEHVALDQQRGDAEGKIELRRSEPFRSIRPAGVIERDLRRMHDDMVDIVRRERMAAADFA